GRVRHGYRVRGSNLARLGGSSGGSPPARTGSDGRTGGAHYFFLLVTRVALTGGSRGLGAHPRIATTYVPRRRSRFPGKEKAPLPGGAKWLPSFAESVRWPRGIVPRHFTERKKPRPYRHRALRCLPEAR